MKTSVRVIQSTRGLSFTILGLASFWFIIFLLLMSTVAHWINTPEKAFLSPAVFALSVIVISFLSSYLANHLSKGRVELGMVPIGGFGMSISLFFLAYSELSIYSFTYVVFLVALFGGFFKMPLNAWIRERVPVQHIEHIVAIKNLVVLLFIVLSVASFAFLYDAFGERFVFKFTFYAAFLVTLVVLFRIPAMFMRFLFFFTANLLFKVKINNAQNIPLKTGALLIANHVSLLDSFLIVAGVPRNVRFVMLKEVYEHPLFNWWFKRLNMIPVPGKKTKENLEEFNKLCRDVINDGHVLCIFPEGQLSRTGHLMGFKKGIEFIASGIDAPILPVHVQGLVGSVLSYKVGDGSLVLPRFKFRRTTVRITIGEPRFDKPTAFELRQQIMELQAYNFEEKTATYLFRKKLQSKIELKDLCQVFALKEVLAIRPNVRVLCTYEKEAYLYQLAVLFQALRGEFQFNVSTTDELLTAITDFQPQVLLTDSKTLMFLHQKHLLSGVDKVFLSDLNCSLELKKELETEGIEVLESLVLGNHLISINTPNLVTRDVTGKQLVQEGSKDGSAGRIVPGLATRIMKNGEHTKVNEVGNLHYKHIGVDRWVDTELQVSMDEEGFLYVVK